MVCAVQHEMMSFPGVDGTRPELHGLMMPRHARGEIHDRIVESKALGMQRMVRVYLPGEQFLKSQLPLLIVNDGHKAFEPAEQRAGKSPVWEQRGTLQLHRMMDGLICEEKIAPSAVVAIGPRASSRLDDFVPHRTSLNGTEFGGGGERYLDFIERDLLPFVVREFPTISFGDKPSDRIVVGTSVGGFSALYAALSRPHVFGAAVACSASFWVDDGFLTRYVGERGKQPVTLAFNIGNEEAPHNIGHTKAFKEALCTAGWTFGADLYFSEVLGRHDEDSWRARIPGLLENVIPQRASV